MPTSLAAVPDSKPPISFDELINIVFTADTRPRILSGVSTCRIVDLIITLILSNAPVRKRAKIERKKLVDRAKSIVASPNPVTPNKRLRQAFPIGVNLRPVLNAGNPDR